MLKSLLFPARCPSCGSVHQIDEKGFCESCLKKIVVAKEPVCRICGKPVKETEECCESCRGRVHFFEQNKSWLVFEGTAKRAVYRFKYDNARWIGPILAEGLIQTHGSWLANIQPQALIPVPIHHDKMRERGHNQAMGIAKAMADILKTNGMLQTLPVVPFVRRTRYTSPQKELSATIRRKNLKKAFKLDKSVVKLGSIYLNGQSALFSTVIVVDDIYTTGATLDAISELLLKGNIADRVYAMTAAVGRRG